MQYRHSLDEAVDLVDPGLAAITEFASRARSETADQNSKEDRAEGKRVLIRKEGQRLIIEPDPTAGLVSISQGLEPLGPEDVFQKHLNDSLLAIGEVEL